MQAKVTRRKTACRAGCNHSIMTHVIFARKGADFLSVAAVLQHSMQSVLACLAQCQDSSGGVLSVRTLDKIQE